MIPRDLGLPKKFATFRPHQLDMATLLAASERRFDLLCAPTGCGKSIIYMAAARLLDARTLVLVGTKGLQDQLMSDFGAAGLVDVRGHGNYPCAVRDPLPYEPLCRAPRADCLHQRDIESAQQSSLVVTNYAYWMTLARYGNPLTLGEFDLVVMDESHGVVDHLTSACTITLRREDVGRMLGLDLPNVEGGISEWSRWAAHAVGVARAKYKEASAGETTETSRRTLRHLAGLGGDLAELAAAPKGEVPWVAGWEYGKGQSAARFCPLWPAAYAEGRLFRGIDRAILCSATITPEAAKFVGIGRKDLVYREMDSTFPVPRRPFIYAPATRVGWNMVEGQKRQWVSKMDRLIGDRLDRKGIVHTRSYDRAREIVARSKFSNVMMGHTSRNTLEVVGEFVHAEPPAVLVSPSVEEGYDFPGDQCRFQIIAKVPFPDTRDPLLAARIKDDKSYRNVLTAQSIIQMYGRGMRSEVDWCETVIVDDHWLWFRRTVEWPKWFRETFQAVGDLPEPLEVPQ